MKKKVFNQKLKLNKETISRLNSLEMNAIKGGSKPCPTITLTDLSASCPTCPGEMDATCDCTETCYTCPITCEFPTQPGF